MSRRYMPKRPTHRPDGNGKFAFWPSLEAALAAHISPAGPDECWLWTGNVGGHGYGHISWLGRKVLAHAETYRLHHGPLPEGMEVCHRCDVRLCCNPAHLFAGSRAENARDMVAKRRHSFGEHRPSRKLSLDDVKSIAADPRVQREIAEQYGVTQSVISRIKSAKAWRAARWL